MKLNKQVLGTVVDSGQPTLAMVSALVVSLVLFTQVAAQDVTFTLGPLGKPTQCQE